LLVKLIFILLLKENVQILVAVIWSRVSPIAEKNYPSKQQAIVSLNTKSSNYVSVDPN